MFDIIKGLCDKRGISINDLEEALGYSKNTLYRLKKQNPGADKIKAIADYFQVSTDYLLGRENSSQIIKGPDNEIAEFYRKVTSDLEMNECEEQELKDDFKAYLQMRAEILKSKGKGK